jgi:hypothetical protein
VLQGTVEWGPFTVVGWQPLILDAFACIALHNGTISEQGLHQAVRTTTKLRTIKSKILAMMIAADVPSECAERLLLNDYSRGVRLNPVITATVLPRVVRGAAALGEARTHDSMVWSMRRAVRELFGAEGLDQVIGLLPADTRRDCATRKMVDGGMIPVRYAIDWAKAAFHGPVEQDSDRLSRFIDLTVHYQLSLIYDEVARMIEQRSNDFQQIWNLLNHGGQVEMHWLDTGFEVRLSKHPFVEDPFTARAFALAMQHLARRMQMPDAKLLHFRVDTWETFSVRVETVGPRR